MDRPQFHLSIPALDLDATVRWYVDGLGCRAGRRSDHALVLDLGGHQLVAQKVAAASLEQAGLGGEQAGIYPRHFGLIFPTRPAWEALLERALARQLRFGQPARLRFAGQLLEHHTFFLIDPAHNWLEFKHYSDPQAVLGRREFTQVGDRRDG